MRCPIHGKRITIYDFDTNTFKFSCGCIIPYKDFLQGKIDKLEVAKMERKEAIINKTHPHLTRRFNVN